MKALLAAVLLILFLASAIYDSPMPELSEAKKISRELPGRELFMRCPDGNIIEYGDTITSFY